MTGRGQGGSYPPFDHGLHRQMRQAPFAQPITGPCAEHVEDVARAAALERDLPGVIQLVAVYQDDVQKSLALLAQVGLDGLRVATSLKSAITE